MYISLPYYLFYYTFCRFNTFLKRFDLYLPITLAIYYLNITKEIFPVQKYFRCGNKINTKKVWPDYHQTTLTSLLQQRKYKDVRCHIRSLWYRNTKREVLVHKEQWGYLQIKRKFQTVTAVHGICYNLLPKLVFVGKYKLNWIWLSKYKDIGGTLILW